MSKGSKRRPEAGEHWGSYGGGAFVKIAEVDMRRGKNGSVSFRYIHGGKEDGPKRWKSLATFLSCYRLVEESLYSAEYLTVKDYELPFSQDPSIAVNCPCCGESIRFYDSFFAANKCQCGRKWSVDVVATGKRG